MDTVILISTLAALIIIPIALLIEVDEFAGDFFKKMTHTH